MIDLIELFLLELERQAPLTRVSLEGSINSALKFDQSPVRFIDCYAVILNDEYLHYEVIETTAQLLDGAGFLHAKQHYADALNNRTAGDFSGAMGEAWNCVESLCKSMLNQQKITAGGVAGELVKAGKLPEYYPEFKRDMTELLKATANMAHKMSRHGKQQQETVLPADQDTAAFAIHLAGSLVRFIVSDSTGTGS